MKYLFLFIVAAVILFPKETQNQTIDIYKVEWERFCKVWMSYVNKYPKAMSASCCEIDHPSNNKLKEEYLGEPMLFCNGQYIYE
jgi:hypothetical protein|tara:strand:- start:629 stop:880 length:252 start_codon:yes stop_codon:yes gene_type:complete